MTAPIELLTHYTTSDTTVVMQYKCDHGRVEKVLPNTQTVLHTSICKSKLPSQSECPSCHY